MIHVVREERFQKFFFLMSAGVCGTGLYLMAFSPTPVQGMGFSGVGAAAPCTDYHPQIIASFSAKTGAAKYSTTGTCTTTGSLGIVRTFPYTVRGSYLNGIAEELIEIAPPPIHQPSHPYGTWHTKYACPSDPWLTVDGPPFHADRLRVKCTILQRADNSPAEQGPRRMYDGKPVPTVAEMLHEWRAHKPMTALLLLPEERQALAAKRDADFAEAKRKADQRIKAGIQQQSLFRPIVLAPTAGQRFINQTSVPIKLSPPNGWVETQVGLDGRPVTTDRLYMVRIERKASNGTWVAHATLPVGAPQAESPTGYTGFGAGAPPSGITSPGSWRMSAQISSPTQTGWSEWVEFVVMAPPSKTQTQKAPKMFGR